VMQKPPTNHVLHGARLTVSPKALRPDTGYFLEYRNAKKQCWVKKTESKEQTFGPQPWSKLDDHGLKNPQSNVADIPWLASAAPPASPQKNPA